MRKKQSRYQTKQRECRQKIKYHSSEEAWDMSRRLEAANPGHHIDAYVCRWCDGWHVGHRPGHGRDEVFASGPLLHERSQLDTPMNKTLARKRAQADKRALLRDYARQEVTDGV